LEATSFPKNGPELWKVLDFWNELCYHNSHKAGETFLLFFSYERMDVMRSRIPFRIMLLLAALLILLTGCNTPATPTEPPADTTPTVDMGAQLIAENPKAVEELTDTDHAVLLHPNSSNAAAAKRIVIFFIHQPSISSALLICQRKRRRNRRKTRKYREQLERCFYIYYCIVNFSLSLRSNRRNWVTTTTVILSERSESKDPSPKNSVKRTDSSTSPHFVRLRSE
jgi:hypothetical protein